MVATTANTALGMFTGIVEEMGTVVDMRDRSDMTLWDGSIGRGTELTVRGNVVMDGAYLGYVFYGCDEVQSNANFREHFQALSTLVVLSVLMRRALNDSFSI